MSTNEQRVDDCGFTADYAAGHPSLEISEDRQSDSSSSFSASSSSSENDSSSSDSSASTSGSSTSSSSSRADERNSQEKGSKRSATPTVQPYATKMERFELFRTEQCYYLIASDKSATAFRVIKMDRTLIEYPATNRTDNLNKGRFQSVPTNQNASGGRNSGDSGIDPSNIHEQMDETRKLRKLPEFCMEDPTIYSADDIRNMLDMIRDGDQTQNIGNITEGSIQSKSGGDLEPLVRAHGVVGFIRFLDCYYLTLITKKSKVGCIGGNIIYTIKDTETFPIKPADDMRSSASVHDGAGNDPQSMLLNMWNRGKRSLNMGLTPREAAELRYQLIYQSVDLGKDFFFSYTYDLTQSLQNNMLTMTTRTYPPPPFKSMYMWNYFQTRELEEVTGSMTSVHWIMPLIHGAFIQRKLQDYGRSLNLSLLARRSRHFAGTRYRKRGVSDVGKVANDVEHEQIIHDESTVGEGVFSSFLQVRGSIPTYWAQESSVTMPKPPIVISRVDPTYRATQLHFEDLFKRYGAPIVVVDLVKQSEKREREVIVGNEYRHALEYLNHQIDDSHKIRYCALDYSHISKHRNLNVSSSLHDVSTWAVNQTGFFCSSPRWKIIEKGLVVPFNDANATNCAQIKYHMGVPMFPMEQEGVLRTNCIDCLDRTNVAQFSAGVEALGQQLVVMGIRSAAKLSPASSIVRLLIDMYVEIGDHIALQYGGSEAHKKVQVQNTGIDAKGGDGLGKHKELLTSIRRYYSNVLTDSLKQEAMNLFLGHYIPSQSPLPLWELENDYYLHNFHVKSGTASLLSMKRRHPSIASLVEQNVIIRENSEFSSGVALGSSTSMSHRNRSRRGVTAPMESGSKMMLESWRVEKIRKRCSLQNDALSFWWRNAIQAYIDQRCWMHLGENPYEYMIPSRFERDHGAADQLSVFDHFFKRPYTRPLQSFRSSQNKKGIEEEKESLLMARKKMSSKDIKERSDAKTSRFDDDPYCSVVQFTSQFGYENESKPYLQNFVRGQTKEHSIHGKSKADNDAKKFARYSNYVQPDGYHGTRKERKIKIQKEFEDHLRNVSLRSDDVSSVLKLSQEAHVNSEILSGPYRGLSQHESAIEVTTVVNEQLHFLGSLKRQGPLSNEEELKRREMDTPGVMDAINDGLGKFAKSDRCYQEVLSSESLFHRRSDLTDGDSMKLYCSFFGESAKITNHDIKHITGGKQLPGSAKEQRKARVAFDLKESRFMNKAQTLGIRIDQGSSKMAQTPALFLRTSSKEVPGGFEQINENLFAREDNRFMVFNDVGVDQWPPKSKTKIRTIEHDMNLLRHTTAATTP